MLKVIRLLRGYRMKNGLRLLLGVFVGLMTFFQVIPKILKIAPLKKEHLGTKSQSVASKKPRLTFSILKKKFTSVSSKQATAPSGVIKSDDQPIVTTTPTPSTSVVSLDGTATTLPASKTDMTATTAVSSPSDGIVSSSTTQQTVVAVVDKEPDAKSDDAKKIDEAAKIEEQNEEAKKEEENKKLEEQRRIADANRLQQESAQRVTDLQKVIAELKAQLLNTTNQMNQLDQQKSVLMQTATISSQDERNKLVSQQQQLEQQIQTVNQSFSDAKKDFASKFQLPEGQALPDSFVMPEEMQKVTQQFEEQLDGLQQQLDQVKMRLSSDQAQAEQNNMSPIDALTSHIQQLEIQKKNLESELQKRNDELSSLQNTTLLNPGNG